MMRVADRIFWVILAIFVAGVFYVAIEAEPFTAEERQEFRREHIPGP